MVRFIFYASQPELFAREISHIKSLLFMYNTQSSIITDRIRLVGLLPHLCKENIVVLLFPSSDEELDEMVNIRDQLGPIPTILVLPDDNTETLQRGMLLHPLFFMAKYAQLSQFSMAVNEVCHIYEGHSNQASRNSLPEADWRNAAK